MSAGWVAASVRSRALAQRRIGTVGARDLAACTSLAAALELLTDSPYGRDVQRGQTLAEAQRAVGDTLLWHLRVLGGWLPRGDARILRVLAAGFEVANVDERLREIRGEAAEPAFRLGGLSTIATGLSGASSEPELRALLARTTWGDCGADGADGIRLGLRLAWAARVSATVPQARDWAIGAATLVVARAHLVEQATMADPTAQIATRLLGVHWSGSRTLAEFRDTLPADARWALDSIEELDDLWRAEVRWWARTTGDGLRLLHRPVTSPDPVIGVVAVLAGDAWRIRGALEVAARGGSSAPGALEVFDAAA